MVEAHEPKHDAVEEQNEKAAAKNWADEVDGGDDDDHVIGGATAP